MILENEIEARVWAAVRSTYEASNYTGAITAAVQLLGDVIRNKSGIDADGQSLVGQAFGGTNPIVRLNALRTESDKDEQKGVEFLLRGIYTGIRNPRSHEVKQDGAEAANAILVFVDWLLQSIDKSKSPFEPNDIIEKVWDEHFVHTVKYASLLVLETPPRIRLDVLLRLLDGTKVPKLRNTKVFFTALLPELQEEDENLYWGAVSERLRTITTDAEFVVCVRLASINWSKCSEIGRLRAENRLLRAFREGKGSSVKFGEQKGWLGLWIKDIYRSFTMVEELKRAFYTKLTSWEKEDRDYVLASFMTEFVEMFQVPDDYLVHRLKTVLNSQDIAMYSGLSFLDHAATPEKWVASLKVVRDKVEFTDDVPF